MRLCQLLLAAAVVCTATASRGQVFELTTPESRMIRHNTSGSPEDLIVTLQGQDGNSHCFLYLDGKIVKGGQHGGKGNTPVPVTVNPKQSLTVTAWRGSSSDTPQNPKCTVMVAMPPPD